MTHRTLRATFAWIATTLVAACSGDTVVTPRLDTPQSLAAAAQNERTLAVELTKPVTADAGMIFSIDGPNILGIEPARGMELVSYRADGPGRTSIDVLVVGPLENGVVAWLAVKGVNSGSPFTARVSQVSAGAAEGFVQRTDLAAYRVAVRR